MIFERDDPDMREAARKARETFPAFVQRMQSPRPGDENFIVKIPLPMNDSSIETVWAGELWQDKGQWTAQIGNVPDTPGFREGDRVGFDPGAIADWAYFSPEGLQGGFSQRVMIARLPERQRAAMKAQMRIAD